MNRKRWNKVRVGILDRDRYRCVQCGKSGRLEVDHILPIANGGEHWTSSNLQTLCRPHHFDKTRRENSVRELARHADSDRSKWTELVDQLMP